VDDDEPVREFTKVALERFGHRVLLAEDGRQALELLGRRKKIDLALLDVTMPVLGGPEALSQIRAKWPNVAVLIASGYSQQEACRLGIPEDLPFLAKPYTVQALAAAVDRALKGRVNAESPSGQRPGPSDSTRRRRSLPSRHRRPVSPEELPR
jgi:CheY-like chemotaxis protein